MNGYQLLGLLSLYVYTHAVMTVLMHNILHACV